MFIVRSQWARERIARAERRPHGPGVRPIGLWCSRHVQRLSPIRATRTRRAAVDPTTSAFHLDPGAFFAQKRHIRLAWDHCKPSRLSSFWPRREFPEILSEIRHCRALFISGNFPGNLLFSAENLLSSLAIPGYSFSATVVPASCWRSSCCCQHTHQRLSFPSDTQTASRPSPQLHVLRQLHIL